MITLLEAEQAAIAAGATPCGARCACHGDTQCQRTEHPHDVDEAHPHLGYDADGQLVQWLHTDEHGPTLIADEVADQVATARREHTRLVIAGLDLDELRAALAGKAT